MKLRLLSLAIAAAGVLAAHTSLAEARFNPNGVYAFDDAPWQEQDYNLPAFPQQPNWQEFFLSVRGANRLFIETGSLSMGEDGVVRYVLKVQSPSGVQNLSVEGIRCHGGRLVRSYAFGDAINKRWIESQKSVWRQIETDDAVRKQLRESLCQDGSPVKDLDAALKQLRATR